MTPIDHQRFLLELSYQLDRGDALSEDQRRFLALVLYRVGRGEDANAVLGLKFGQGQSRTKAIARARMSMILHWVACAVSPDPGSPTKTMSVEDACSQAVDTIVPFAKAMYPGSDDHAYDSEYIMRCWGNPKYAHMRSTVRGMLDPDFPYGSPGDVKDTK